MKGQYGLLNF